MRRPVGSEPGIHDCHVGYVQLPSAASSRRSLSSRASVSATVRSFHDDCSYLVAEAITPLAAALQWVMRDGSGMLGGLFFAYGVGPKFDANVKFWRLYADVINDVGLTLGTMLVCLDCWVMLCALDMLAPFAPRYVTQILCVSSVCKAMCGVAAGATRSSLTAHFAKTDNMAGVELSVKSVEMQVLHRHCGQRRVTGDLCDAVGAAHWHVLCQRRQPVARQCLGRVLIADRDPRRLPTTR